MIPGMAPFLAFLRRFRLYFVIRSRLQSFPKASGWLLRVLGLPVRKDWGFSPESDTAFRQWLRLYRDAFERSDPVWDIELARRVSEGPSHDSQPQPLSPRFVVLRVDIAPDSGEQELCLRAEPPQGGPKAFTVKPSWSLIANDSQKTFNAVLDAAEGLSPDDVVCLVFGQDQLDPSALYWLGREIFLKESLLLLYSDHDHLDSTGAPCRPFFKPRYDPIQLQERDYLGPFLAVRCSLLRAIFGKRLIRELVDRNCSLTHGAILALTAAVAEDEVERIPRLLYHRSFGCLEAQVCKSQSPGSLSSCGLASDAGAVKDAVGTGEPFPRQWPDVTCVIPTRDRLDLVRCCLESLAETRYPGKIHVLVVDNGTTDPDCLDYLRRWASNPRCTVRRDARPFNFSALNNAAVQSVHTPYLVFMNNDIEVTHPNWLCDLMGWAMRDDVGAVGAKLVYPNGTVQHGGTLVGLRGVAGHVFCGIDQNAPGYFGLATATRQVSALTAAVMVIAKKNFEKVGGFNEEQLPIAFNDVDLCLKLRKLGLRNIYVGSVVLTHHESASRGFDPVATTARQHQFAREIDYMKRTWATDRFEDPFYSPNLSLEQDYVLAGPPRI
jgi:GT2 family glycosyltransferase